MKSSDTGDKVGLLNPPHSPRFELAGMYRAELEQLNRGDKFWGKDEEAKGASDERSRMDIENKRSFFLELQHRQAILHGKWQQEFAAEKDAKDFENALAELNDRKAYLKFVFSSDSSIDVMNYQWKSKAVVNCIMNKPKFGDIPIAGSDDFRGTEIIGTLNRPVSLSLPEPNQQMKFSVHLDGLQQTRALTLRGAAAKPADRQPAGANLGSALRSRSLSSVAENYLQSDSMVNLDEDLPPSPAKDAKSKGRDFTESSLSQVLRSIGGKQIKLPSNLAPRKVEAWDGHSKFKWDQELMLRAAFSILAGGRNIVSQSELTSTISKNADVRDLLRFTVFGAWLKRKEYHRFLEMFTKKPVTNQEDDFDSPDDIFGLKVLSLDEWMETAHRFASEQAVPRRWVRTDDEHRALAVPTDPAAPPEEKAPGWFALQSRQLHDGNERAAAMSRALFPGECVWGLCGGGIAWLPAVVEAVNYAAAEPHGPPTVSYDIRYFMTSRELRSGRTEASNRPFLSLPSELRSDVLQPKKNQSEKRVCEGAFDVVDVEKAGRVDVAILLQALRSTEMRSVVMSSVALSMVVFGTSSTLAASSNVEVRFPLSAALEEVASDAGNEISKSEFVEICMYAVDLSKYNQTYLELGSNRQRQLFNIVTN